MPNINRIRVNNIKYNFGTQFYDDFIMRFSGKNTIYDLANGGGKSVLMLLLLQNLIPNCTLDEKQPVEKLFRTGSKNSTIHSLIEWKLDKENQKNNYKYMLTGFCARKSKDDEENKDNASIEYFNYCIFYRDYNDNDIKNLPLKNDRERITYNGLKAYLRELEKKDLSLEIRIFERKGEYQRFIAEYGLYESQWEIIRGINKTEGHVRTYFESNYKTTRKVVEDLLIEEIIEKSFRTRVSANDRTDDNMAVTLLNIKDKLIELAAKKDDINAYDKQIEALSEFKERVTGLKQLYFGKEELINEVKKCYHTLNKIVQDRENELDGYRKQIEELGEKRKELEKYTDTIKVLKTKQQSEIITSEIEDLEIQMLAKQETLREKESELLIKEAQNDYMDYLYYKRERDGVKETIDAYIKGDTQSVQAGKKLVLLAAEKNTRNKKAEEQLDKKIYEQQTKQMQEIAVLEEEKETLWRLFKEISLSEYLHEENIKQITQKNEEIYRLREELEIILEGDINKVLDTEIENKLKTEKEQKNIVGQLTETKMNIKLLEKSKEEIQAELEKTKISMKSYEDGHKKEKEILRKLENIKLVYDENDTGILLKKIEARYKETIKEVQLQLDHMAELKEYKENFEKGFVVGESTEVKSVVDYINKYHNDVAQSGTSYMAGLDEDEKNALIEKMPMLPYCVVIKNSFTKVSTDIGLKKILESDYAVMLVKKDALVQEEFLFDSNSVSFVMKNENLFTSEEEVKRELERITEETRDLQIRLEKLGETEETLREDYDFIKEYTDVYKEQIEKASENYKGMELMFLQLQKQMEYTKDKLLENQNSEKELYKIIEKLESKEAESDRRIEKLRIINRLDDEVNVIGEADGELTKKLVDDKKKHTNIQARIKAREDAVDYQNSVVDALKQEKRNMEDEWNKLYREYYEENVHSSDYEGISDEELLSVTKACRELVNGTVSDIKDKKKLMENYDVAMEKSLQAIDYKGIDINEIKKLADEKKVRIHTKDELKTYKKIIDGIREEIKACEKELVNKRSRRDVTNGILSQGVETIKEKYGSYEELAQMPQNVEKVLSENKYTIKSIEKTITDINNAISETENMSKDYIIFGRDIEIIMQEAKIPKEGKKETYAQTVDIREKIHSVREKYEKYKKETEAKKEEIEQKKHMLTDRLAMLTAYRLAEEIKTEVTMPKDNLETEELICNLGDIILCIELEKQRIEKNIQDMEKIKANFENQCIQSCINIKTELERLPKLSKIYMDNEHISIIGLDIPYVKEEDYKKKMAEYIDEIVLGADKITNEEERVRFIKNQLSWKKLFQVIVNDMNAIKLTLYKRERIKEQSRYLRYEEAVGSTGQSQGIYIQFLIAIINYITAINSGNTESRSTGKVIFIDNPFGAAKDIYIWEPIFKLLKTNNVQLVVPCRGATPAITGRFDVNYVLGQKMTDGKQQTVVVEYYSNVDREGVEYERLSFEQNELIFN